MPFNRCMLNKLWYIHPVENYSATERKEPLIQTKLRCICTVLCQEKKYSKRLHDV